MKRYLKVIIPILMIILLLIVLFASIKTVPTGSVGVKTRFGAVQETMINEGINLKLPFIEKIVLINCKTKKIETSSESSTKDMQTVNVTIAVNYNVNKNTANSLYQEVGLNYEDIIKLDESCVIVYRCHQEVQDILDKTSIHQFLLEVFIHPHTPQSEI